VEPSRTKEGGEAAKGIATVPVQEGVRAKTARRDQDEAACRGGASGVGVSPKRRCGGGKKGCVCSTLVVVGFLYHQKRLKKTMKQGSSNV